MRFVDKSKDWQEQFRVIAKKIRMTWNSTISEYFTKHRVIRQDMIAAGCQQLKKDHERSTIRLVLIRFEEKEA